MRCNIHYFPAGLIEFFNERTEVLLQLLTPYRRYYEWHLNYFVGVISSHVSRRTTVTSLNRFFDNSSLVSFSALVILLLSGPLLILRITSMIRSVLAVPRFFEYRKGIEHKFRHRGTSNNLSYRPSRKRLFPAVAIVPDGTRTRALLTNQLYSLSTMHPIMRFRPAYGLRTTTATNAERTLQKIPCFRRSWGRLD